MYIRIMKLVYFNARGLAETSRMLLAVAGQDYEDFRFPFKIVDMSIFKFERPEFDAAKAKGELAGSLHKLPALHVDGVTIGQSKAIERYLARRFGMMGSNELEAAQIDAICEYVKDFKSDYQSVRKCQEEEKPEKSKIWFEKTLPEKLGALDAIVGKKYAVGNSLSLADITLYNFLVHFFDNTEGAKGALDTTENIKTVVENTAQHEALQEWIRTRPVTDF